MEPELLEWTLEKRRLSDLRCLKKNPRRICKHDADQLKKSISKFGLCEPIVINRDDIIIGGHQRYHTLKRMKKKETIVMVPEEGLCDKDAEELCVRLNRNRGEWDQDILANEFEVEEMLEWGFTKKDFGDFDLDAPIDGVSGDSEEKEAIIKFIVSIPDGEATSFENQLDDLIKKFPTAKKKKKKV